MEEQKCMEKKYTFLLGTILGAIVFVIIYGIQVLYVTNDSWLLNAGGDLTQHYLGWKIFRNSQWSFQFGLMEGVVYPQKVSVMYMDSIPIFAIVFKILSPILPSTFQYFGIWGIMTFMLQGGVSALVLKRFTQNDIISIIGSLFFLFCPIFIVRMFGHTALAGQWIILMGIYLFFESDKKSFEKQVLIWSIILSLTVCIHMYFFPMIFILLLCYILKVYVKEKNFIVCVCLTVIPMVSTLMTLYLLGAFYGNTSYGIGGLGYYSANLNALFNPQGYSKYLNNLPMATEGQYEGIAYLGLGIMAALIVVVYLKLTDLSKYKISNIKKSILCNLNKCILSVAMCIFFVLALSPKITFNNNTLLEIKHIYIVDKLLNMFRASGRFMWPICYLIVLYILSVLCKRSKSKQVILFIILCVGLQISDISDVIINKHNIFSSKTKYESQLKSDVWESLSNENYNHVIFISDKLPDYGVLWDITNFAVENGMTLNDCYLARKDSEGINLKKSEYLSDIKNNVVIDDAIYIFDELYMMDDSILDHLNCYIIDGIVIGVKDSIDERCGIKKINDESKKIEILPKNNMFLSSGQDSSEGRKINSNGISFGPYLTLPKGSYEVVITGSNLSGCNYDVSFNNGQNNIEIDENLHSDDMIYYSFSLESEIDKLEFRVINNSDKETFIKEITLLK